MLYGGPTISLKKQSRKAESACGVQSILGRAWSPNPGQSAVTTRKLGVSLSRSDRISSRVEIELRAGSKTTVGPSPATSKPSVTSIPFHIQRICRAIAIWRSLLCEVVSGVAFTSRQRATEATLGIPSSCRHDVRYGGQGGFPRASRRRRTPGGRIGGGAIVLGDWNSSEQRRLPESGLAL